MLRNNKCRFVKIVTIVVISFDMDIYIILMSDSLSLYEITYTFWFTTINVSPSNLTIYSLSISNRNVYAKEYY